MKPESRIRILCVCLGNICRSPTAEAVLRALGGSKVVVDSAGTGDWHIGNPPHPPAVEAAGKRGYDLSSLRARQVVSADFERFDLILAMDRQNLADLEELRPRGNGTSLRLYLDSNGTKSAEVPDPYLTGDFDEALDLIEMGARHILARLSSVD